MGELIGLPALLDWVELRRMLARLALDLAFTTVVIQLVYFRRYGKRDHVFTCFLFNAVTLCLCLLLRKAPGELGFGMALFGVFGILRYRTEQIRSRDLTYLFIGIGLGIINGIATGVSLAELLTLNGVLVTLTALLELGVARTPESSTPMIYDRLDLLQPGRKATLIADITTRTGLAVVRVETERIDMLRDAAEITIYFRREPRLET